MRSYKAIPSCPGYLIADGGSVVKCQRNGVHAVCVVVSKRGRCYVKLTVAGKRRRLQVSRLLLETFVGPPKAGQQALHADDDPRHNYLRNLRWGTPKDNGADAKRNGRTCRGSQLSWSKLTPAKVKQMRRLRARKWSYARLGRKFNVSAPTAYHACVGNTWQHV